MLQTKQKGNQMKKIDKLIKLSLAGIISIFIVLPFIYVFANAFVDSGSFSLGPLYKGFLENKKILLNSIILGLLSSLITSLVSLFIGSYAYVRGGRVKKIISLILLVTMISPPFVTSLSYINLFGRRGLISHGLLRLSVSPYGLQGIVLMQVLGFISLSSLMVIASLDRINPEEIKAARDLGANTNRLIVDIIFPKLKPAFLAVFFLSFIRSLADFGTPAIIGGSYNVLATEGYMAIISRGNIKEAAIINIMILLPSLVLFFFYSKLDKASFKSGNLNQIDTGLKKEGLVYRILQVVSIFFITWLLLQYSSIILSAFTRMKDGHLIMTLETFIETKDYITSAILRSIIYSLISALLGSFIGLVLAYYLVIRKSKLIKIFDYLVNLPYILPGTFFGLGYLLAFKDQPLALAGTSAIVVLNILFKQLPFSSKLMKTQLDAISMETVNSARNLGANYFYEFKDVVYPLAKKGLFVSFINAFTASMTTVGSIIFLVYPGRKVLTLVMFDVIASGKYNIGSVIALIIIIICLAVNGLYYLITKEKKNNAFTSI